MQDAILRLRTEPSHARAARSLHSGSTAVDRRDGVRPSRRRGDGIAVNYVAATERLHTAGQPDAATLATLAEQGFELVVNLAPPSSAKAPSPTRASSSPRTARPTSTFPSSWQTADVRGLRAVQRRHERRARPQSARALPAQHARVGVHVPVPRHPRRDVPPEEAMQALRAVWIPRDQWATFTADVLARHNVDFELPKP